MGRGSAGRRRNRARRAERLGWHNPVMTQESCSCCRCCPTSSPSWPRAPIGSSTIAAATMHAARRGESPVQGTRGATTPCGAPRRRSPVTALRDSDCRRAGTSRQVGGWRWGGSRGQALCGVLAGRSGKVRWSDWACGYQRPSAVRPGCPSGRGPAGQRNSRSVSAIGMSLMLASRRRIRPDSSNSHCSLPWERYQWKLSSCHS